MGVVPIFGEMPKTKRADTGGPPFHTRSLFLRGTGFEPTVPSMCKLSSRWPKSETICSALLTQGSLQQACLLPGVQRCKAANWRVMWRNASAGSVQPPSRLRLRSGRAAPHTQPNRAICGRLRRSRLAPRQLQCTHAALPRRPRYRYARARLATEPTHVRARATPDPHAHIRAVVGSGSCRPPRILPCGSRVAWGRPHTCIRPVCWWLACFFRRHRRSLYSRKPFHRNDRAGGRSVEEPFSFVCGCASITTSLCVTSSLLASFRHDAPSSHGPMASTCAHTHKRTRPSQ